MSELPEWIHEDDDMKILKVRYGYEEELDENIVDYTVSDKTYFIACIWSMHSEHDFRFQWALDLF